MGNFHAYSHGSPEIGESEIEEIATYVLFAAEKNFEIE